MKIKYIGSISTIVCTLLLCSQFSFAAGGETGRSKAKQSLTNAILTRQPIVIVSSNEPELVQQQVLKTLATKDSNGEPKSINKGNGVSIFDLGSRRVISWNYAQGFDRNSVGDEVYKTANEANSGDPAKRQHGALSAMTNLKTLNAGEGVDPSQPPNRIHIMEYPSFQKEGDPYTGALLEQVRRHLASIGETLILVVPGDFDQSVLKGPVSANSPFIEYGLPDAKERAELVKEFADEMGIEIPNKQYLELIQRGIGGLTHEMAVQTLRTHVVETGGVIDYPKLVDTTLRALSAKYSWLTYKGFRKPVDIEGSQLFKATLMRDLKVRQNPELAEVLGAKASPNYNFYGIGGTGKSTKVNVIAFVYDLPVVDVNFALTQSKWLGESQAIMNEAANFVIPEMPSAVINLEELGEQTSAMVSDGGTGAGRAQFGILKEASANGSWGHHVLAISDNLRSQNPSELMRQGRFGGTEFWDDYEDPELRKGLIDSQIKSRSKKLMKTYNTAIELPAEGIAEIVKRTDGMTPAEVIAVFERASSNRLTRAALQMTPEMTPEEKGKMAALTVDDVLNAIPLVPRVIDKEPDYVARAKETWHQNGWLSTGAAGLVEQSARDQASGCPGMFNSLYEKYEAEIRPKIRQASGS